MPDKRYVKGCGKGCIRCWYNRLNHGSKLKKKMSRLYLVKLHDITDPTHRACAVARASRRRRTHHLLQEARHTHSVSALEHRLARLAQILDTDGAFSGLHHCFSQHRQRHHPSQLVLGCCFHWFVSPISKVYGVADKVWLPSRILHLQVSYPSQLPEYNRLL